MKKKQYAMQPEAVAMALTNRTHNAAILLLSLTNFFISTTETYQGKRVLKLSDAELAKRTWSHIAQVRRGKAFLKKHRLIVTDVKKDFKYHKGATTSFIHVPDEVMILREKLLQGNAQICTVGNEQNHISQYVQGCALPIFIEEKSKSKAPPEPVGKKQESSNHPEKKFSKIKEMFGNG